MGFLIPVRFCSRHDMSDDSNRHMAYKVLYIKFDRLVLFNVFLLYPHVSSYIISVYNCRTIDGVNYLVADFSVLCSSVEWQNFALYNIPFLVLYPVGIPVFYMYKLSKMSRSGVLNLPTSRAAYGFLYEAFFNKYWYFELVDMLFKLLMISIVPGFGGAFEMQIAMGVVCLYLLVP